MKIKKIVILSLFLNLLFLLSGCGERASDTQESQKRVKTETPIEVKLVEKKSTTKETPVVPQQETIVATSNILERQEEGLIETSADLSILASGDSNKGQKLYSNKLKEHCGMRGGEFAHQHTQEEWGQIKNSGKLGEEIASICHGAKVKDKYLLDISAFVIEFASDSGNVPTGCS